MASGCSKGSLNWILEKKKLCQKGCETLEQAFWGSGGITNPAGI